MKRSAVALFFAVVCGFWGLNLATEPSHPAGEQLRKGLGTYHDQLLAQFESSLVKLNESLHDWKEHRLAHSHLGTVASHSVDVLSHLEDLVSSESSQTQRRRLSQIYDEASKKAAEERLAGVTAEAEARYAEAVVLLQDAASRAIQNNTEDLMARLADKLRNNNVVSTGKVISDQLQALQLADQVSEIARGLVPEFDGDLSKGLGETLANGLANLGGGLDSILSGSLLDRLRPRKEQDDALENIELAHEDDTLMITAKTPTPETINNVTLGPVGEPVQVSESVTITPLERDGEDAPFDAALGGQVSRADFYKERNEVFDRFDEEAQVLQQSNTMRRALQTAGVSIDTDRLINSVESSLEALRSMRARRIAVSSEMAEAIKARAADARERFQELAFGQHLSGRRLNQADVVVDGDAPPEDASGADDGFLTFPGESLQSLNERIASDADGIMNEEDVIVSAMESSLPPANPEELVMFMPMMPMMPMMMSQEISFVFIPIDKTTDAEELIESVAEVVMSTIAEASISMFMEYDMDDEFDVSLFGSYDDSYDLPEGRAPHGFGPVQFDTSSSYREPRSAIQRRRRLKSSDHSITDIINDSYDLELYFYDPTWFNSAQASQLVMDEDDDLVELSLAIRLGGPEDLGGLPPDVLLFIAESEAIMDAMMSSIVMPSYSVFDATSNQVIAQAEDSENLADTIVKKLQSAYGAYGQPARAQGQYSTDSRGSSPSEFDIRWLGVMFGAVGIVLIVGIGAITAFQSRGHAPPGYVVIEDIQAAQPSKVITAVKPANRKTSNLPA